MCPCSQNSPPTQAFLAALRTSHFVAIGFKVVIHQLLFRSSPPWMKREWISAPPGRGKFGILNPANLIYMLTDPVALHIALLGEQGASNQSQP